LCEKYYQNPNYSHLLIDKLWYKTLIIAGKDLYLPSKNDIIKLVKASKFEKQETKLLKQVILNYADYLANYAENLEFVIFWRKDWYNQLKLFSSEIKKQSEKANSIDEIYKIALEYKNKFKDDKFNENFNKLLGIFKKIVD